VWSPGFPAAGREEKRKVRRRGAIQSRKKTKTMSKEVTKEFIENLLALPAERLKSGLPGALKVIQGYGVGELLQEYPDFLVRLLTQLRDADPAELFSRLPGLADQLMELLWVGVTYRAEQVREMKALLEKAERDIHVNIEASDSPFKGHFMVQKGKILGRPGLLHFKDEDFRFMGPTEVLMDLLTGDLPMGFSNLRLQTAGHSGWVSRIAPIIRELARLLKGARGTADKIGSGI
jgi:hypothetical protein